MNTFLGQLDVFDPNREPTKGKNYAGEVSICTVTAVSLEEAIYRVLREVNSEGIFLKSIDFFGPSSEYQGDATIFGVSVEELVICAEETSEIAFSNVLAYEKDD